MKRASILVIAVLLVPASSACSAQEPQSTKLSSLQEWVDQGRFIKVSGNNIFIVTAGKAKKEGHRVLIVHGFPGSSWDWSGVVPKVAERTRVVVPDMLLATASYRSACLNSE